MSLEQSLERTRERLHSVMKLPADTGCFLMPSGSDAEYIPLLITKTLNPGKPILSVVTCHEEVGSGTLNASGGKLFSNYEPLPHLGDGIQKKDGDPVRGLDKDVETLLILARAKSGEVINSD